MSEEQYKRILKNNRAYQRELEKYIQKMVLDVLEHEGLVLNEDESSVQSVAEYLLIVGPEYSIYQWIEDTKKNYPECFKEA
jgi:hypothetical protein